jgi:hypothetical protein
MFILKNAQNSERLKSKKCYKFEIVQKLKIVQATKCSKLRKKIQKMFKFKLFKILKCWNQKNQNLEKVHNQKSIEIRKIVQKN